MGANQKGMDCWPRRSIGDLLRKVSKPVEVIAGREYRQIGIRSHCKGIFHKPSATGKTIGSKRVFWVEPGCFIVNIVFAWEQAIAMTTDSERGMIASHRFPMYRSLNGQLLPEYAYLYFSSPRGKYDLGIASPGGAGRNKTLGQDEFKRLKMPVPPIECQHLAVNVVRSWSNAIDQMSALIETKRKLNKTIAQQLLAGKISIGPARWKKYEFAQLFMVSNKKINQVPRESYLNSGQFPVVDQGKELIAGYCNTEDVVYRDIPVIVFGDHTREVKFIDFPFVCGADGTQLLRTTSLLDLKFGYHLLKNLSLPSLGYSRHMKSLKEQIFRIPDNLPIQKRIASIMNTADREVALLEKMVTFFRAQKIGLMQKLLMGQ